MGGKCVNKLGLGLHPRWGRSIVLWFGWGSVQDLAANADNRRAFCFNCSCDGYPIPSVSITNDWRM